jgi:arylsulfatase A-like enzyme
MDDAVGQVLKKLADARLDENTLIFYVSDNGGPAANASNNHPLRGHKAQTLEGGIRVPFVVHWKGRLAAGKYDQPVIQLDIAPTALAAAGVSNLSDAKLDGVNLLPHLMAENHAPPHVALYWRFGPQTAIRMGNWKLVRHLDSEHSELYDLAADISEKNNLAKDNAEKFQELQTAWNKWNSQLAEPRWQAPSRRIGGRAATRSRTDN